MASQRVLLLAVGGVLATSIWDEVCRWSDSRSPEFEDEWGPEDWPLTARREIDALVAKLHANALTPPVLYRIEYFDAWSMGDVFHDAFSGFAPDRVRQLHTNQHEIFAARGEYSGRVRTSRNAPDETRWLHARVSEAVGARPNVSEERLLLLIRSVVAGLYSDSDVEGALHELPGWYAETDPPHPLDPSAG